MAPTSLIWTLLAALLLSQPAAGAQAPNLAGTWVLDPARSDPFPAPRRRNQAAGGGETAGLTLVVGRTEGELIVTRKVAAGGRDRAHTQTYRLDGAETTVAAGNRSGAMKARVRLEGGGLVIDGTRTVAGRRGEMAVTVREEWSVSEDGAVLTITTTRSARGRDTIMKQVFARS